MTGIDHERNELVLEAARWLALEKAPPKPIVPALRQRFGLTAPEACAAAAEAHLIRVRAL